MISNNIFKSTALVLLSVHALLFTPSCKKKDKGVFYIKGQLMDSCGGTAQKGIPLQVSFKKAPDLGGSATTDDNIGSATTGADGYFEIKCKDYGNITQGAHIDIFNANTRYVYLDDFYLTYNQTEYDFVKGYTNGFVYKGTVKINISGVFSMTDTLYVGYYNGYNKYYTNLSSSNTYDFLKTGGGIDAFQLEKYRRDQIYWGFGFNDFKSNKHLIDLGIGACGSPDTTTIITINK